LLNARSENLRKSRPNPINSLADFSECARLCRAILFGFSAARNPQGQTSVVTVIALDFDASSPSHNAKLTSSFPHLLGPWQADFAGLHISAIKDALSGLDRDVDHCPVSV
jgi:hypothetical protein